MIFYEKCRKTKLKKEENKSENIKTCFLKKIYKEKCEP